MEGINSTHIQYAHTHTRPITGNADQYDFNVGWTKSDAAEDCSHADQTRRGKAKETV
jgi:hypothetical protein